ncbi:MAG: hypothetical protein AAF789_08145, partial [Bacteroidota bacterium]
EHLGVMAIYLWFCSESKMYRKGSKLIFSKYKDSVDPLFVFDKGQKKLAYKIWMNLNSASVQLSHSIRYRRENWN